MTTDIRTTHTIRIGDFRVRVGEQEIEDDAYDAAVVESKNGALTTAFSAAFGNPDPEWQEVSDAPIASAEREYVAVGLAVEQYLDQFAKDEGGDPREGETND